MGNHKWNYIEEKHKGKLHKNYHIKDGKRIRDTKKTVKHLTTFSNESKQTFPKITQSEYTNVIQLYSEKWRANKEVIYSLHTKHSSGHDDISVKLLKFLAPARVRPLTLIINQSLVTGIFPDKPKVAKVIPRYKKYDTLIMDKYRPISLLSSISKIFEKAVFFQLSSYLIEINLFHDGQYGFREKHSTELSRMELMDRVISA